MSQRRILFAVVAALAVTTIAYLVARGDSDGPAQVVAAEGGVPTTEADHPRTTHRLRTPPSTAATPADGAVIVPPPTTATTAAPSPPVTTEAIAAGGPPPTTTIPAPPFRSSVGPVTEKALGASWHNGCPIGPEQLRSVKVSHWGFDGAVHTGELIVAAGEVDHVVAALADVYAARFPIERMEPVARYGGDDGASMRANNTSAFNCRFVAGTTKWSEHSYGAAIDINPLVNPYVKGSSVDPPEGAAYADRRRHDKGMIHNDDAVVRAFAARGWEWGGNWRSGQDYQHFSASGR